MKEETTSRLEQVLRDLSDDRTASEFIECHKGNNWDSFSDYYIAISVEKDKKTSDIIRDAGLGDYAYQLINGRKKPTNRDYVIALCIACGMSVKETDRTLRLSDHYPLNPKDERDVRIVVCINNGMTKVMDVNLELDRFGLRPIACK